MKKAELQKWLLKKFRINKKDLDKNIFEVSLLDSFNILVVILEIEKKFKIKNFQKTIGVKKNQKINVLVKVLETKLN
tara:strand:+ start:5683 stop:5913 length:231 start_codon:yes stop_codon:yes gene_type:complete